MSTLISKGMFRSCALLGILIISMAGCRGKSESADWRTRLVGQDCPVSNYTKKDCTIMMGRPKNKDGGVRINAVDTLCEGLESRIVAVDKEGKSHLGMKNIEKVSRHGCRSTSFVFVGFALEDIAEFRFQTRPCQEKAIKVAAK